MKTASLSSAIAVTLAILAIAGPAHAAKIGGDVNQSAVTDNVITAGIGANVYARTSINTVYDSADVGGDVRQSLQADNVITAAIGSRAAACTAINSVGERDCSRR